MALKPHIRSLEELADRVEIAAGYAPSIERRKAFAAAHGYPVADDIERILQDRTIEAAVSLTPPNTHLELVERCAAAGKHVLLEKPIDGTVARARRAVEVMERAGRRLAIVLQHRFRGVSRRLAELVQSGELGRIVSASASVRWWRPPEYFAQPGRGMKARDGGGVLITQAIHTLDLLLHLAGPHKDIAGFAFTSPLRAIDTEDVAAAAIRFRSGAIGTLDATTVAQPGYPERIDIAGTRGSAVLETFQLTINREGRDTEVTGSAQSGGGGADPMAFDHGPHRAAITEMLDAIAQNREPSNSARSGLRVQRLIEDWLGDAATRS